MSCLHSKLHIPRFIGLMVDACVCVSHCMFVVLVWVLCTSALCLCTHTDTGTPWWHPRADTERASMCLSVCLCVSASVCVCESICLCLYVCICASLSVVYVSVCDCIFVSINTYSCVCIDLCLYGCVSVSLLDCAWPCVFVSVFPCVSLPLYESIYVFWLCTCCCVSHTFRHDVYLCLSVYAPVSACLCASG